MSPRINYLEIVKKAWIITWSNRSLWWLGILLSIGEAGTSLGTSLKYSLQTQERGGQEIKKFSAFLGDNPVLLVSVIAVFLIIVLGMFALKAFAKGALIKSIQRVSLAHAPMVREGLREGKKYFWKLISIEFFIGVFIFSTSLVILLPIAFLFYYQEYLVGTILSFLALLIIIPLIFLASFIRIYGILYVLLGELTVWSALERAYFLLRNNVRPSILAALVMLLLNIAFGLITLMAFLPLLVILVFFAFVLIAILQKIGIILTAALAVVSFLFLSILLKSIYSVIIQSVWIFFFQEIAKPKEGQLSEPADEKELEIKPTSKADPVEGI